MRRCILTDTHSRNPRKFIEKMKPSVDGWAFLGDYDDPQVLNYLRTMPGDNIVVIGNHEYEFGRGGFPISGETTWRKSKLEKLWANANEEKEFILDCIEDVEGEKQGTRVVRENSFGRIIYTHSLLMDTLSSSLWKRVGSPNAFQETFENMAARNIQILFRGHDHYLNQVYCFQSSSNRLDVKDLKLGKPFKFEKDKTYFVSIGAFVTKRYAIYDEEQQNIVLCSG